MANPAISAVTVFQNTTAQVTYQKVPGVICRVTFTTNGGANNKLADFTAELSVNGGADWFPAVLWAGYQSVALNPNNGQQTIFIDNEETFNSNELAGLDRGMYGNAMVRLTIKHNDNAEQNTFTTTAFNLNTVKPIFTTALMAEYIGSPNRAAVVAAPLTLAGTTSGSPITHYRISRSALDLVRGSGISYIPYNGGSATFNFQSSDVEGPQDLFVKLYDQYFNETALGQVKHTTSAVPEPRPWWQWTPPEDAIVTLVGSTGNLSYTGIKINADGTFTPDRSVSVQVYGRSTIPMTYKVVLLTSDVEKTPNTDALLAANVDVYHTYDSSPNSANSKKVKLTVTKASPATDDFNKDVNATITVEFKDSAGNTTTATKSIRLNTRIYETAQKPINPDAPFVLREVTSGSATVPIQRTMIMDGVYDRSWAAVFYPESHSFPKLIDGELDEASILYPPEWVTDGGRQNDLMQQQIDNGYDPVKLQWNSTLFRWEIIKDTEGRPTIDTWDANKMYGSYESSATNARRYWVFDNTNRGDFVLEFQHFNLDTTMSPPPLNPLAPYRGDVLVLYDATAPGCLEEYISETGETKLRLADATLLTEIAAYTGSGQSVVDVKSGRSMLADPYGGFSTEKIIGTPQVVLMLFTDASYNSSGFHVKASTRHQSIWENYDVDYTNGEIWIHKHSSLGTAMGAADVTSKLFTYSYLNATVTYDFETGEVIFGTAPAGTVTADYSYYNSSTPGSNKFLAKYDDLVDYQEAPIYVTPVGAGVLTSAHKADVYETDGHGRVTSVADWDKDRGIVTFSSSTPGAGKRVFADYYHHTYYRLSADGYGDLTFYHNVLVPHATSAYPDYTWTDLKIVNEGDAVLEDGVMKFGFRGYDTENDGEPEFVATGQIDRVLDMNRPWDIQKGTDEETYDRMAAVVHDSFIWYRQLMRPAPGESFTQPPGDTVRTYERMTARGIYSAYRQGPINTLQPRQTKFSRVVWVLGGSSESGGYPDPTSPGQKRCSLEVSGLYYSQLIS